MGRAVPVRGLELVMHHPARGQRQPLFRYRRPADVAAHPFQLVLLMDLGTIGKTLYFNVFTMPLDDIREALEVVRGWCETFPRNGQPLRRFPFCHRYFRLCVAGRLRSRTPGC